MLLPLQLLLAALTELHSILIMLQCFCCHGSSLPAVLRITVICLTAAATLAMSPVPFLLLLLLLLPLSAAAATLLLLLSLIVLLLLVSHSGQICFISSHLHIRTGVTELDDGSAALGHCCHLVLPPFCLQHQEQQQEVQS